MGKRGRQRETFPSHSARDHTDTYGLRKVFPENAYMPDSEVAVADEGAVDSPRNRLAEHIRRGVAEVVDNQRLQDHPRLPRCPAAVRLPRRTLDSHSIA